MIRWEYLVVHYHYHDLCTKGSELLNEHGAEGWELVAVDGEGNLYTFKRPLA